MIRYTPYLLLGLSLLAEKEAPADEQGPRLGLVDAVRMALSRHPELRIAAESVRLREGAAQSASGQFDWGLQAVLSQRGETQPLQSHQQVFYGAPSLTTYTTQYQLGLSKQFRFGLLMRPSLQVSRIQQSHLDQAGTLARVEFQVVQPLLRGRGAEAVAAQERSAQLDEEMSLYQLRHTIAQRIYETGSAYWSYVAAVHTVASWQDTERRAAMLLSDEQRLVHARERAAAGLKQLEGNLHGATASRIDAELLAVEARQALGVAMGLSSSDIEQVPLPRDTFVSVAEHQIPAQRQVDALVRQVSRRRADHLAVQTALRSGQVLWRGARRDLLPQLDLEASLGYSGLSQGNGVGPLFTALGENISGVNFLAGLTFLYPVENRRARGTLLQREASVKQAQLSLLDLERRIGAAVSLAAATLRNSVSMLKSADAAVAAYREAVVSEKRRLRAGLSTIFDVLQTENRLTTAEIAAIRARARVASTLLRLRFESGTLIEPTGRRSEVSIEQLTTPPPAVVK